MCVKELKLDVNDVANCKYEQIKFKELHFMFMDWFGKKNELNLLELLKNFRSYEFDFSQFNCFVFVKCISLALLFPFYSKSLSYLSHITTNSKTLWFLFPIIMSGGLVIKKQAYA